MIDHLWQSTLVAAGAAVLTMLVRDGSAQVRHVLWFAASLKFLVPFSVLATLGSYLPIGITPAGSAPEWSAALQTMTGSLSIERIVERSTASASGATAVDWRIVLGLVWLAGSAALLLIRWRSWRRVAQLAAGAPPMVDGPVVAALRRLPPSASGLGVARAPGVPVLACDRAIAPGLFGLLEPVLLWPRGLEHRLDAGQIEAILAHERAHLRRRDNLTAAVHMVVEMTFWFHPMVWWIGARLLETREQACDDAVLDEGCEPHVYAEGILRTCRFAVDAPLAGVAAATGADLEARIASIVTRRPSAPLRLSRRVLLGAALVLTLATPIAIGATAAQDRVAAAVAAPVSSTLAFEAASVRRNAPVDRGRVFAARLETGRLRMVNLTLGEIVRAAYGQDFPQPLPEDRMSGGPDWMESERFTIEASAGRPVTPHEMAAMLRTLLAERFSLLTRVETRDLPVFTLVPARRDGRLGPELRSSTVDCATAARCGIGGGPGRFELAASTMPLLAFSLSELTGRPVHDRTGLTGSFDGTLEWAPTLDERLAFGLPGEQAPAGIGPSIFTALEEQFGLRLVPDRGPVEFLVVERASPPAEN